MPSCFFHCNPILFDLDGTLTASDLGITRCVQYALRFYGIEVSSCEELRPFIGPPLEESFRRFYGFSPKKAAEAVDKYRERFREIGIFENRVYSGVPELLSALRAENRTLAIATSKPYVFTVRILEHFGLAPYFDPAFVVGADLDVHGRNNKSDIIAETLRRLKEAGHSLQNAVMIGDRLHDVEGAAKNGLPTIGVRYGYAEDGELEAAGVLAVADSAKDLQELLCSSR